MELFIIKPTKVYYGGCAVVIAETKEEAIKTYKSSNNFCEFLYDDGECLCLDAYISCDTDTAKVIINAIVDV